MSSINPQITTVFVGTRTLREVTIYPLSLADQGSMAKILSGVFTSVMAALSNLSEKPEESEDFGKPEAGKLAETLESVASQLSNINIAETIVGTIQENLEAVLGLVVDPNVKITMDELTNEQFYGLVEIIYEVNYEGVSKNFLALVRRARNLGPEKEILKKKIRRKVSHSRKPSPESAVGTITD